MTDVFVPSTAADVGLGNVTNDAQLKTSQLDVDGTLSANSDTRVPSQKAAKMYADQLIAAADAMVFKGVIDCSTTPNYPAADRGATYRVSVAGKIGGAAGTNVEAGDILICLTDGTAAGTQAGVGASWSIAQANLDGAVIGPAAATSGNLARYSGPTGKLLDDSGVSTDTDPALAANSDARLATQKAVKAYADTKMAGTKTLDQIATANPAGADVDIHSHKLLNVTAGLASTDGANVGQIPLYAGLSVYGDGSDGAVTFDGSTTILGIAPASSKYTLTRDIFLASSTINNGVTIITNGFRIFCSGTLTNNGTIQWNGANGGNTGTAGGVTSNASSSFNQGVGTSSPGTNGGAGTTANGSVGATSAVRNFGGAGGSGGGGGSGVGGSFGGLVAPAAGFSAPRWLLFAVLGMLISGALAVANYCGGTGGGGGGGDGTNKGGAGGSGGGIVIVCAKAVAGTGAIQARGGNGGSPTTAGTGNGGGGGGGGGVVIVVSESASGGAIAGQTIDANGGAFGNGIGGGVNGNAGSAGLTVVLSN
jgi:hypothetical protein